MILFVFLGLEFVEVGRIGCLCVCLFGSAGVCSGNAAILPTNTTTTVITNSNNIARKEGRKEWGREVNLSLAASSGGVFFFFTNMR